MHILAFDTCFDGCSACVAELQDGVVSILSARMDRFETGHAERLVPMIGEVMADAGVPFESLRRIAVTTGPGTFTGTRIGIAAARALALATNGETVGASSLLVMAEVARRELGGDIKKMDTLAVVVDARRGEVYAQVFGGAGEKDDTGSQPMLLSLDDASRLGGEARIVFVGSGADAVAAIAAGRGRDVVPLLPRLLPDAEALARVAASAPASSTVPLTPLYLRPPDAKPQDGKAVARA